MSINVIKPGLLTTVQDLGRHGYQKYGVIVSGAMDSDSCRLANLLVDNEKDAAVLEMTISGPTIEFQEDTLIAICGADMSAEIDGHPFQMNKAVWVKKASVLQFKSVQSGCRTYMAVAGGVDVPRVMDSYSTYLRAGIGGFKGRALQKDDVLPVGSPSNYAGILMKQMHTEADAGHFREMDWGVSMNSLPDYREGAIIRTIPGRQAEWFTEKSRELFLSEPFTVSTKSDRMGYRLNGPELSLQNQQDLLSEAVAFGTIQVPPDGNPIVLMADRQTTGGYPKIGQVITADLPAMAQLKPGEKIYFKEIKHSEAQTLLVENEKQFEQLKISINLKKEQEGNA
ncbi:biotin-dependent carboxyltransferase family protein [Lentibacillus sp.]|uniref:5-oxoprolinase subunit C family protein n=1 Tax=Lentibacillus sp. TaxID=1925746 RepID=UPI002B4B7009|nr:biotin-dependent carboxyltransferase family protein [Lentibacillus sp.]HLS10475.1 biotin-dependent carboxyltransferase family protein [Lentibacillus sp.]